MLWRNGDDLVGLWSRSRNRFWGGELGEEKFVVELEEGIMAVDRW
jgi:hypothetical protein